MTYIGCMNQLWRSAMMSPMPASEIALFAYLVNESNKRYWKIAQLCKTNHTKYLELVQDDMLAIDDLGTEPVEVMDYGNIITPIIDLLTKRYEAQLFTIVTTNLDPKDIRKRYGDRIADRLNEMMAKIVYRNPTYRMDEIQTDGMS